MCNQSMKLAMITNQGSLSTQALFDLFLSESDNSKLDLGSPLPRKHRFASDRKHRFASDRKHRFASDRKHHLASDRKHHLASDRKLGVGSYENIHSSYIMHSIRTKCT